MREQIEFLRERGKEFYDGFDDHYRKQRYALASFHLEQAVQLWLKYLIALKVEEFPHSHDIKSLWKTVAEVYRQPGLEAFLQKNILSFNSLNDIYINSRYLPHDFEKEYVDELKTFVDSVIARLKETLKIDFNV